ncbi:Nuclear pore protein-like protein [Pleurostoma richardsiae]|uniref:Nuclear pore protein-like protein n=1 Tax=Pleurostoma richardsiae TaxID=41990 RepID=A0AA38S2D2_9PEZI|nr:Nuclear pore protein-like protein [Pleurostoma richardsiae]
MSAESIVFDNHGDLKLRVGDAAQPDGSTVFMACSRALARVSPVFDRMLYGDFSEAKSSHHGQEWIVDLPEEQPIPMIIFLSIAHAQFHRVPRVLSADQLYDLTALTHYYDATRVLGPWVNHWVECLEDIARDANILAPKMLWIYWELGRKEAFLDTARRFVMEADGPIFASESELGDLQMPPDIIASERITAIRTQTIQSLLDVFRDMINDLLVVDEKPRWCQHATWLGPHRCESMILGSVTFCLSRAGLWPLPEVKDVTYSLDGLCTKLRTLVIHDIGQVPREPAVDHRKCNPTPFLLGEMDKIMRGIPDPVTDYHRKHLDEQAKKFNSNP